MILFTAIFPDGEPLSNMTVGNEPAKYATIGTTLIYDTLKDYSYDSPIVDISYPSYNLSKSGQEVMPTIQAYQTWGVFGHSGKYYEQAQLTDYSVEYSVVTESENFSLDKTTGKVTCVNNESASIKIFEIKVVVTMTTTGDSVTKTIIFNQKAGTQTIEHSAWVTKSLNVSVYPSTIEAKGGDATVTTIAKQERNVYTYWNDIHTDTTIETRDITVSPSYTINGEGFTMQGDVVTAKSRGTVTGDIRTATITATYENVTGTAICSQEANYETTITYGTLDVTLSYPEKDASEGSVSPILSYSQTRYQNYTSLDTLTLSPITSGATINYSESKDHVDATVNTSTGIVTWKANTSSSRSCEVSVTVTLNGFGVMTSATSKQSADSIDYYTYSVPKVSLTVSDIPASGGTISSGNVSYSQVRTTTYVSGRETNTTLTSGGTVSYSTAVSAGDLERNETTRTKVGTLTATVKMNNKTGSTTVDVYQEANVKTITEVRDGEITYGNVVAGNIINDTIPAGGGTGEATAANGYQEWNKSETITYYSYTSGWDDSEITEEASNGVDSITPNYAKITTYSGSLRNNIKNRETLKSQLVTWSGNNNKSATGTMYIYQEGNYVTDLTLSGGSVEYDKFNAGGDSLTPSSTNASVTYTFTSGYSTSTAPSSDYGTLSRQVSYSMTSATGFTLNSDSTGQITTTNNKSTSERSTNVTRTETVTWKHNDTYGGSSVSESITNSCTITQQAGYYSYGDYEVEISSNIQNIIASGGAATITARAYRTYGWNNSIDDIGTEEGTVTLSIPSSSSATLNGNKVSFENNTSTSTRSVVVTATCNEDTSKKATITITQGAGSVQYTINNGTVSLAAAGETKTLSITYNTKWNGVQTATNTSLSGYTITEASDTSGAFTASGTTGTLSVKATNNTSTLTRTATYTISKTGYSAGTITATQAKGSVTYNINDASLSFTAAGSTETPSVTYDTYWNGVITSSNTALSGYSLTESSDTKNAFTTNGTSVTASANTTTSSRTATYNIIKSGYTSGVLTCSQNADSIKDYTHVINISADPETIDASGGPSTITATCDKYTNWESGNQTGPASETPTLTASGIGFTLNGNILTASNNSSSSSRSCTVTAICGGESASCIVTQEGFTDYIVTYGTPTISIGDGMTAKGGSATVTASVINTYASGTTKEGTVTLKITSNGNNRFSLSGSTLSHDNMGTTTSESVTVTAYNADSTSKTASATKTITNSVDYSTVQGIDLSSFSYPEATTSANYSINPSIGNVTVSLQDTYQSGSTGSTYNVSNVTAYTKSFAIGSIQYFDIDTSSGKCTTKSANSTSSIRSTDVTLTITLTGNYRGTKTASFNTTIYQQATTNYKATIYYNPPSDSEGWIITNSTITPTSSPGSAEQGNYQTLSFKAGESLTVNDYQGNIGTVAIGLEAYVYVYVDGAWNLVGYFTHKNENYTVYI